MNLINSNARSKFNFVIQILMQCLNFDDNGLFDANAGYVV